jgi:hypothetical protein
LIYLLDSITSSEISVAGFFGELSDEEAVHRVGDAWTPLEHLAHLNTAVSAVARGFGINRLLLRIRFGRSRSGSRTYDQIRDLYRGHLAAGGRARGGFIPTKGGDIADRAEIFARWARVNARLRAAVSEWSDRDLDRLRLPHPLMGNLTAREMLWFTLYHNDHHVTAAKSRLPRFTTTSGS